MAEEVKTKSTSSKKVADKVEASEITAPVEEVVAVKEVEPVLVEESTPEVPVVEPVVDDETVEVMSKRGRRSKSDKIAEFAHELGVKIHNEPHLEDLYRAEYAEKVAKLK